MVEDSKKRGRGQRGGGSTHAAAGKGRHGAAVAAADQDAFAAFTTRYRDMLRFADADEAEAVYSMVSLTQAAHRQQQQQLLQQADIKGPVIEVAERRAVKRRPVPLAVPAASACSEGGRSDSSAKSAPGPPQHLHHQHWQQAPHHHHGPSMLAAALGPPGALQHQQPHAAACHGAEGTATSDGPGPEGDIHPGALGPMAGDALQAGGMPCSMPMPPMAGPYFPPGCMPGMMMGPAGSCPPASCMPFMPPWAFNPAMMQAMMCRGLPMPPLPMPPPGMLPLPFLAGMPPLPGMMGAAAAEPAAGIPVTGPLPPAGNAFKAGPPAAAASGGPSTSSGPASKGASAAAAAAAGLAPPAWSYQQQPAAAVAQHAGQAAPATPAGAAGAAMQLRAPAQQRSVAAGPAGSSGPAAMSPSSSPGGPSRDVLPDLEQLDLAALKPWVLSHFCEDVYLLLLDVWRPDSAKVREAIWAWKLHVKGPRPAGAQPDYRAFLVSLFGLDKLTQLTAAAAAARQGSSTLAKPASPAAPQQQGPLAKAACVLTAADCSTGLAAACTAAAAAEAMTPEHEAHCAADCEAAVTTSNLSSEPGAALTAPGPHVMTILLPERKAGGASATSPHRAALEGQQVLQ